MRTLSSLVAVALACALSSCGSSDDNSSASKASARTAAPTSTEAPPPPPETKLTIAGGYSRDVHSDHVTLRGRASTGAKVRIKVAGRTYKAKAPNGRWSSRVALHIGTNTADVTASKPGFSAATNSTDIVRHHSQAELAALRAARAARAAQARQDYINSAKAIPYKELLKDAGPYKGTRAVFRGQILQIQQDGRYGGIMLLSVTDEGYGIWDDNVWIDYDDPISANEGDIVTVYGKITGQKSYETQAGGETYVPRMHAKYIVE